MAKKGKKEQQLENLAIKATEWIGTPISIIVHSILFVIAFAVYFIGVPLDEILLVVTTIVSLEAIYLALFIQLTVNKNTQSLSEVEEDIEEIQEDVEGLEGEFDEIAEDVEGLEGNIKRLREGIQEIEADIEDISEDVDKIAEEETSEEDLAIQQSSKSLKNIEKEILTLSTGILALKDDLEILKKNRIEVVISDIKMPVMDGIELLKRIRKDYQMVQVIIITGYVTMTSLLDAFRHGAYTCVFKPINDMKELDDAVKRCVEYLKHWQKKLLELQSMKIE